MAARERLMADLARLRELLGPSVHDRLVARDARAVQRRAQPDQRHRLAMAIDRTARSVATLGTANPEADVVAAQEVTFAIRILEHWRNDPCGRDVLAQIQSDYPHTVAVQMAADAFRMYRVSLRPTRRAQRTSDLEVDAGNSVVFNLEVKSPEELQLPNPGATPPDPNLVAGIMKQAGYGMGDQLEPTRPGMLSIGGFYLDDDYLRRFASAIGEYFNEKKGRRSHIMGILLTSYQVQFVNWHIVNGVLKAGDPPNLVRFGTHVEYTLNNHYTGPFQIPMSWGRPKGAEPEWIGGPRE